MIHKTIYPLPCPDGTYHVNADGRPAYTARFRQVGKFHDPGMAPAKDEIGWLHINPDGQPAYDHRYEHVWGFYHNRAAVKITGGYTHIDVLGTPVYPQRYRWVGNFQEGACIVQTREGFFHIDENGSKIYEETYAYVGDFRDGIAVATSSHGGLCRHIKRDGSLLHPNAFIDLDVFHKGYARAKDSRGWHHINLLGQACYIERYISVEPFYNGLARVDCANGRRLRINETGITADTFLTEIAASDEDFQSLSSDIVGYWKSFTITCAVQSGLFDALPGHVKHLATTIGISTEMTQRLLRATTELGLTQWSTDGCWSKTRKGDLLTNTHPTSLSYSALEMVGEYVERWGQLLQTLKGVASPGDVFEEASHSPDRTTSLHLMMNSYALRDYTRVVAALDLPNTGEVIDAGGGLGVLARRMHAANPMLRISVLERPEVCRQASELRLNEFVRWVSADFNQPWPISADVITMARVLHDWDDKRCLEILLKAKASLKPGGRLIIIETVLSDNGWEGGMCDLHLLAVNGGKERTLAEFVKLGFTSGFSFSYIREASGLHQAIHFTINT